MSFTPTVEVIGLYSPAANAAEFDCFVRAYVEDADPENFDAASLEALRRLGRNPVPLTEDERREVAEEISYHLSNATYVEVIVRNADAAFNPGDFSQPDPLYPGQSQVAWNETYLTEDGEAVISGYPHNEAPSDRTIRVVFVIHFWNSELPLASSYGDLLLPAVQPLPARLWRLVPYEAVD